MLTFTYSSLMIQSLSSPKYVQPRKWYGLIPNIYLLEKAIATLGNLTTLNSFFSAIKHELISLLVITFQKTVLCQNPDQMVTNLCSLQKCPYALWKVSLCRVFLVCIFPHSDEINSAYWHFLRSFTVHKFLQNCRSHSIIFALIFSHYFVCSVSFL